MSQESPLFRLRDLAVTERPCGSAVAAFVAAVRPCRTAIGATAELPHRGGQHRFGSRHYVRYNWLFRLRKIDHEFVRTRCAECITSACRHCMQRTKGLAVESCYKGTGSSARPGSIIMKDFNYRSGGRAGGCARVPVPSACIMCTSTLRDLSIVFRVSTLAVAPYHISHRTGPL